MSTKFRNTPLVELIAEVRWTVPPLQSSGPVLPANLANLLVDSTTINEHEVLFMNYAARINAHGFNLIERIVPSGFPLMANQPVYRFRSKDSETLYQMGVGMFSANAVQPYKSWKEFEPFVNQGLSALFDCLNQTKQYKYQLSLISLRYIDAFKGDLQRGEPVWKFATDTLGFHIELPRVLKTHCTDENLIKPALQFSIPINIGNLNVSIGEGAINNEPAYLMDTTVAITKNIGTDSLAVMKQFNAAHDVIHETFVGITEKLHTQMGQE